ncbi:DUF58 domain-containing protein [Myxosarcina sp. GI1]|uniref:DUF58 domain-containing protein n=1 Tax=Myxosarcina sp. GI1 TaxID=1541065 RepID=UPI00055BFCEC|nr:DUF58 domain-containing protein [Myxosarcina sp. GI1]
MKFIYRLFCSLYAVQQWATRRFTTIGWGVLVLIALSALVGLDTKQTRAAQIFMLLLAMAIVAIIYSLRFRYRFSAERILPRFATVGSKLQYPIFIYNRTNKKQSGLKLLENFADPRPNYAQFKQMLRLERKKHRFISLSLLYYQWLKAIARQRKATAKTVDIPTMLPDGKTKVTVELEPCHRGSMRLTGVTVARPDPFGIFNAFKTVSLAQSLLILPKRYQLPPLRLSGGRSAQSGDVALTSSVGDSEEFVSLRDYRPGDPLRKIHWRSWAKTDKPVIKEEQNEYFVRHALILDTFLTKKSVSVGKNSSPVFDSNSKRRENLQPPSLHQENKILEEAISVAASFACDFQTQESLLDLMFVGQEAYCFTAGRGLGNAEKMLEILAGVSACGDRQFDRLTQTVLSRVSLLSGCICILLAWDEARKNLVNHLQTLNVPLLVLIIAEEEDTTEKYYGDNIHCLRVGKIQEDLTIKLASVI